MLTLSRSQSRNPARFPFPFPLLFTGLLALSLTSACAGGSEGDVGGGDAFDPNGPTGGGAGENPGRGNNGGDNGGNNGGGNFNDGDNNQGAPPTEPGDVGGGNTNVSFGGAQDFGFFRALLDAGTVPRIGQFDAPGFFAEHHTPLPDPVCGERVCLQAMLGVMSNLVNGSNCTMLQIGLNSPLVADPGARPPLTLAVVVDVSGSMRSQQKLDFVRQGLSTLVDSLRDGDQVAIITYESNVSVPFELAEVAANRHELREVIEGLEAGGGTNLHGGLQAGYQIILDAYDSGRQNRVILLSDGQPTSGVTNTQSIFEMSSAFNSEGIGLTTVGLGRSFNIELMQGLAERGDGNFYFLENAGAVNEVFAEEISYFTVPVAFDLELELAEGSHYEFGRAMGASLWEDSDDGGRLEVPSVFLAHRESHDDITDDGGRRGGGSALLVELMPKLLEDDGSGIDSAQVATIHLRFREPGTDRIVEDTIEVNYPHAPWITLSTGFFDAPDLSIVQKSFVMLNIYVGIEMACGLFHEGSGEEGIGVLERLTAAVMDYNEELEDGAGDTDMNFNIALLQQLRDVMLANGAIEPEVEDIPDDPWPAD